MKSKPFRTIAVLLLAALGWVAAPGQAVEQQPPPAFSEVDKDKNGYISADESVSVPGLSEQMTLLDRNADGKVSKEEYAALQSITPGTGSVEPQTQMQ